MVHETEYAVNVTCKYRLPLRDDELPIILLWSEKAGCTTLVKWFFWQLEILSEAINYHKWIHNYEQQVYKNQTDYIDKVKKGLLDDRKELVKFIRNPYYRAISSFLDLSGENAANRTRHHSTDLWKKIRRVVYGDPNAKSGVSFKMYLDALREIGVGLEHINGHVAAQVVRGEEGLGITYYKIEELRRAIPELERRNRLKSSPIVELNRSPHHRSWKGASDADVSSDRIIDEFTFLHRPLPVYDNFLDEYTEKKIQELFEHDIRAWESGKI